MSGSLGGRAVTAWMRAVRQARRCTQLDVAEAMGVAQNTVSRTERQGDLLVSTLANYVAATGGQLRLVAEYGDEKFDLVVPAALT